MNKLICLVGVMLLLVGVGFSQVGQGDEGNFTVDKENSLVNDVSSFLTSTSPAFLIILGIILIVGSGFAKIVGYILIIYAIIRLLLTLL